MTAREELPIQYVYVKEEHNDYNSYADEEPQIHSNITSIKEEPTTINGYMNCYSCDEKYENFCIKCRMLLRIFDNNVDVRDETRARETLPTNLLKMKLSGSTEGVFAAVTLPKGVIFGPYEGLDITNLESGLAWRFNGRKIKNVEQIGRANWMKFVNCTKDINEKNLTIFQCNGFIYYQSDRPLVKDEELLVYYDDDVIENENMEKYYQPIVKSAIPSVHTCTPCHLGFSSSDILVQHQFNCPFNRIEFSQDGRIECPQCKLCLIDTKHLESHIRSCRAKNKRKFLNVLSMSLSLKSPATDWRQEKYQELFGYLDKFKELYLRPVPDESRERKTSQMPKLQHPLYRQKPPPAAFHTSAPAAVVRSSGCAKRERGVASCASAIQKPAKQKIVVKIPLTDSIRRVLCNPNLKRPNMRSKMKEIFGDSDSSDNEDPAT